MLTLQHKTCRAVQKLGSGVLLKSDHQGGGGLNKTRVQGPFLGLSFRLASDCYVSRPFWANFWSCCAIFLQCIYHRILFEKDIRLPLLTVIMSHLWKIHCCCRVPIHVKRHDEEGFQLYICSLHSLLINNMIFFSGGPKPPLPKSPVKILASLNWQQHLVFSETTPGVK